MEKVIEFVFIVSWMVFADIFKTVVFYWLWVYLQIGEYYFSFLPEHLQHPTFWGIWCIFSVISALTSNFSFNNNKNND